MPYEIMHKYAHHRAAGMKGWQPGTCHWRTQPPLEVGGEIMWHLEEGKNQVHVWDRKGRSSSSHASWILSPIFHPALPPGSPLYKSHQGKMFSLTSYRPSDPPPPAIASSAHPNCVVSFFSMARDWSVRHFHCLLWYLWVNTAALKMEQYFLAKLARRMTEDDMQLYERQNAAASTFSVQSKLFYNGEWLFQWQNPNRPCPPFLWDWYVILSSTKYSYSE